MHSHCQIGATVDDYGVVLHIATTSARDSGLSRGGSLAKLSQAVMASRRIVGALVVALCWASCAGGAARQLDEVLEPFPLVINTWPFVSATEAAWAAFEAVCACLALAMPLSLSQSFPYAN